MDRRARAPRCPSWAPAHRALWTVLGHEPIRPRLHETYRYPKPALGSIAEDAAEYRNFFEVTRWPNWPGLRLAGRAQLERGIDAITSIVAPDGERRPAILIGINPHKAGSDWTPWHDEIDPRSGFVRYYGDNKPGYRQDPMLTSGNRALVGQQSLHAAESPSLRVRAAPLLFFENVIQEGRSKGYRRFRGIGLLDRVERVVQVDRHSVPFLNYRYDCMILRLDAESNELNWEWIAARRDPSKTAAEASALAPESWRRWVTQGPAAGETIRQRLLTYRTMKEHEQRPEPKSPAHEALLAILAFYATRKARFEALAERIAQAALKSTGAYRTGWLTSSVGSLRRGRQAEKLARSRVEDQASKRMWTCRSPRSSGITPTPCACDWTLANTWRHRSGRAPPT